MDLNTAYVNRLNESRAGLESLFPRVDRKRQIYPKWTLKELLDHITGWDEMVIDTLNAHLESRQPANPAEQGIDAYNEISIQKRSRLSIENSIADFKSIRLCLTEIIQQTPAQKLAEMMVVPWGGKSTVSEFLEIFARHEEEHTADLLCWLEDPEKNILDLKK